MALLILILLALLCFYFAIVLYQQIGFTLHDKKKELLGFGIGFLADFCDTLGIGSFMVTTASFKATKFLKNSRFLPGTMLIMHGIPTLVEALFFITIVKVEALTLFALVIAAVLGSVLGSRYAVNLPKDKVQWVAGIAMALTSLLMIAKKMGWIDLLGATNDAMGLHGTTLFIGTAGNFILGALMSLGVGLYAPCMVMVYLLGLNPLAAFPIMMVSCAALMPVSSIHFIKKGLFQKEYMWAMIFGGVCGVLVAAIFVKNLSLDALTWLIVGIGFITAFSLFRSALKDHQTIKRITKKEL